MACGSDQLCFTNIDNEIGFVGRGCAFKPVFNSIYFFCNKTDCNNQSYKQLYGDLNTNERYPSLLRLGKSKKVPTLTFGRFNTADILPKTNMVYPILVYLFTALLDV